MWEQTNSIPKYTTLEYTITKNREFIMNDIQTILAVTTFVLSVWFLMIIISEVQKEKRWKLQKKKTREYMESQEKKRSTNKIIK